MKEGDIMKAQIQQFGNTLALCIPETFVEAANLTQGSVVDISIEDHKLVIQFSDDEQGEAQISLEQLLAGITTENIHGEVETGTPIGSEVW
jgi:antitoxin MazE